MTPYCSASTPTHSILRTSRPNRHPPEPSAPSPVDGWLVSQASRPSRQRPIVFAELPYDTDGEKKDVGRMPPGLVDPALVLARKTLIPRGMPYQGPVHARKAQGSIHTPGALNFQLLNYLPPNQALRSYSARVITHLDALSRLDAAMDQLGFDDPNRLRLLTQCESTVVDLCRETRTFILQTQTQYTVADDQPCDPRLQSLHTKLTELEAEIDQLGEMVEELSEAIEHSVRSRTEVTPIIEQTEEEPEDRMNFRSITQFNNGDAQTTVHAIFTPLKQLIDTFIDQEEIADDQTPGSEAWCHAVATILLTLKTISDLLTQHGQRYADQGGSNGFFLDWIDHKLTDVHDETDQWGSQARCHADALIAHGYTLR